MYNKYILIMIGIIVSFPILSAANATKNADDILQSIYIESNMNLSAPEIDTIKKCINACLNSDPWQQYQALPRVIQYLDNEIEQLKRDIQVIDDKQLADSSFYFYKFFVINHQREYFNQHFAQLEKTFSQWEKYKYNLLDRLLYISHYFGVNQKISSDLNLSQTLIDYIEIEQQNIVLNYYNLARFIFAQQKTELPLLMRFWNNPQLYTKLALRARKVNNDVIIQMEDLAVLVSQAVLMAGSGLYSQWISQEDADLFQELTKQQNQLTVDFEQFINTLQQNQKEIATNIINAFKEAQADLEKKYAQANQTQQQEIEYLFKAINLDQPRINYLLQPAVSYDQIFQASVMNTPPSHPWYNIYQVGDWEFDSSSNSFWQYQIAPYGTPFWKPFNGQDDPSRNAIFTEYIPSAGFTYDIEIDCTIIQTSYPFFVGVLFNRGRWIAADPERIWQYRLLGLYGTQSDLNDNQTQAMTLHFAQQILQLPKTKNDKESITSPLELITTQNATQLYQLDKEDAQQLHKQPITYTFSITTQPTQVAVTLSKKSVSGTQTSVQKLFSTTLQGLDNYLALFHGIGFMSAGCKTKFTIKKPVDLRYSDKEIKSAQGQTIASLSQSKRKNITHAHKPQKIIAQSSRASKNLGNRMKRFNQEKIM